MTNNMSLSMRVIYVFIYLFIGKILKVVSTRTDVQEWSPGLNACYLAQAIFMVI